LEFDFASFGKVEEHKILSNFVFGAPFENAWQMIKMTFYSLFMEKEMKKEFYFGKSSPPPTRPAHWAEPTPVPRPARAPARV
jgi:hypothetical protein